MAATQQQQSIGGRALEDRRLSDLEATLAGGEGRPVVLVGGPPTARTLFREVQRRLSPRRSIAVDLWREDAPAGVEELARRLLRLVEEVDAAAVFAHGLAVPVALLLPPAAPLVLANGPIRRLDSISRQLSRLPPPGLRALLRPALAQTWLASSAGLRRAVINPYVMDHDTVAMLYGPLGRSSDARAATAAWLRSLPDALSKLSSGLSPGRHRIAAVWGMGDRIYPFPKDFFESIGAPVRAVPGGRWLFPEEQPWALADALQEILEQGWPGGSRGP
jgi:hypothetical protein